MATLKLTIDGTRSYADGRFRPQNNNQKQWLKQIQHLQFLMK